jgi:hypothetical protein
MMREAPRQVQVERHEVGPWTARLLRMPDPDGADSYRVAFGAAGNRVANVKDASLGWTGVPDSAAATRHPQAPVTKMLAQPPPSTGDSLTITATAWGGPTHRDTVAASGTSFNPTTARALPIPPVPTAVWVVIGAFLALLLGIVGGWLWWAQRTARRRADGEAESDRPATPAPVAADLPTPDP